MRAPAIAVVFLGGIGCSAPESSGSPLAALGAVDRAEVTMSLPSGPEPDLRRIVRDPATLATLRTLATAPGPWAPIGLATEPAGDVRAAFYRDTQYLGVLSAGARWVGARGPAGGATLFRTATPAESAQVAALRRRP